MLVNRHALIGRFTAAVLLSIAFAGSAQGLDVRGKVLSPTLKPVKGAKISAIKEYALRMGPGFSLIKVVQSLQEDVKTVTETATGDDGSFTISLPAGDHCLAASAQGFATGYVHWAGAADPEVDFILEQSCKLEGKVVGADQAMIAGVRIALLSEPDAGWIDSACFAFDKQVAVSGPDGSFTFTGLKAGRYSALVSKAGMPLKIHERIAVPAEGDTIIPLLSGFSIKGKVTDPSGKPIHGAAVAALGEGGGGFGEVKTGADGSFRLESMHPGDYRVFARADGFIAASVEKDGVVSGASIDIPFVLDPGIRLMGNVVDQRTGGPVKGATVFSAGRGDDFMLGGAVATAVSAADGSFELVNPSIETEQEWDRQGMKDTGRQVVVIRVIADGFKEASPRMKVAVDRKAGLMEGVVVEMLALSLVSGKVIDKDGKPVSGARLFVAGEARTEDVVFKAMLGIESRRPVSGPDGSFTLFVSPAGDVKLLAFGEGACFGMLLGEAIEPGGERTGVEIRIPQGGSIAGLAKGEDGKPLAGFKVNLYYLGADGNDNGLKYALVNTPVTAALEGVRTGDGGAFAAAGLAPGVWEISVEAPDFPRGQAVKVVVEPGKTAAAEVTLMKPASIAGIVLDQDGKPVAGANVYANLVEGEGYGSAESDKDGRFIIRNVRKGQYRIGAYIEGYDMEDPVTADGGATEVKVVLKKQG